MLREAKITTSPRKWRVLSPTKHALNRTAWRAINMIRNRITKYHKDEFGQFLPKLKNKNWFFAGADDERWHVPPLKWRRLKGGATVKVHDGGYGGAKKQRGKSNYRDGYLTGDMWDAFTPTVRVGRKGAVLRLFFRGSSVVSITATEEWDSKRGRNRTRTKRTRVENRFKAASMQYEGQGTTGRRMFTLLALQPGELGLLRDDVLRHVRIFK